MLVNDQTGWIDMGVASGPPAGASCKDGKRRAMSDIIASRFAASPKPKLAYEYVN